MKTFSYRGYARDGARARGMLEALDPKDAREKLASRGILAESVESATTGAHRGRARFDANRRAAFYRELAALARAGVPVVAALDLLLDAQPDAPHAPALAGIRDRIREGAALADAVPQTIPDVTEFEIALLQTGQRAGRLGDVLDQMAGYMEEEHRIRDSIQSALIYPALVVVLALVIGIVMMLAVLPRLGGLFRESGMELPAITRALIWLGQEGRLLAVVALAAPLALMGWGRAMWTRPASRAAIERRLLRWPLVGTGIRLTASIRFVRTLAILLKGGVPLVDCLPLAGRASGNSALDDAVRKGADQVRQGRSVAAMLAECPLIGEQIPPWYRAGEASGDLPGMLEQAARRFQMQWETLLQRSVRLAEPVLIVIVGGFVLLIALAILMPMLSLNRAAF